MTSTPTDEMVSPAVVGLEKDEVVTSANSDASIQQMDTHMKSRFDNKLAWKVDLNVLLPMLVLNFLSLMGRTNIGAAFIQELPKDLKLNAMKVFCATSIAFVPLIVFEVPSNLIMRLLERKYNVSYLRYLSLITVALGKLSSISQYECLF